MLKSIAWLLGAAALAMAALVGINATDDELSPEAKRLLSLQVPPAPSESNGYIDFLALDAPADAPTYETGVKRLAQRDGKDAADGVAIDSRVPRCEQLQFLSCVAGQPALREIIESHVAFLTRYRAMRAKPEFIDLHVVSSLEDPLPSYRPLFQGHRLSLMLAALDFNAGRRASALAELEAELAFHRRVGAGSRGLFAKMVSYSTIDDAALFASELARRLPVGDRASWRRLEALTRMPTKAELDVIPALDSIRAERVDMMRTRRYVRLSDEMYELARKYGGARERPWWDPVAPLLYRPNYSVNRFVAQSGIVVSISERPSTEFLGALAQYRARAAALEPRLIAGVILSPASPYQHLLNYDLSDYVGRMHGHAGAQALIALQVRLRSAGITQPAEVAKALAGPLGAAYPDPFTGEPMAFDAARMTLSFLCDPKYLSGLVLYFLGGKPKVELPL